MGDSSSNLKSFCACGCGAEIPRFFRNRHKGPRFKKGHHIRGQRNPRWNNGTCIDDCGYINVKAPNHPFVTVRGYVKQHRLVWEQYHKAILLPWADVHHINDNRKDNRIGNLNAMMHGQHMQHNYYSVHKIAINGQFTKLEKS